MPQISDLIAERSKKNFVKKSYRPWDLSGDKKQNTSFDDISSNSIEKDALHENSLVEKNGSPLLSTQQEIKKPIENNKSSILEFKNSSNQGFNRVQMGSIKGSKVQNKSPATVQLNPNIDLELGFNNELYITKKLIKKLNGNEKKLFFFVVSICSLKGMLSAGSIQGEDIDSTLEMPRNSRETSIKRLVKKGLLIREQGKRGSNGVLNLSISETVKFEALNYLSSSHIENKIYSLPSIRVQNEGQNRVQLGFNTPYSSSNLNINTTTDLLEDWKKINFEPLIEIGFSETQLKQLASQKLDPVVVQESIYHFAFGLKNNETFKNYSDPLKVLMGVLRKGLAWSEKNYVSEQELAQIKINEHKKLELERLKKLKEEEFELSFKEWVFLLKNTEKEKILLDEEKKNDWKKCLKSLKSELSKDDFQTWVEPLVAMKNSNKWVLYAYNIFQKENIEKNYINKIKKFLGDFNIELGSPTMEDSSKITAEEKILREYFKMNVIL